MIIKLTLAVGNDYPRNGSLVTIGTNAFQVKEGGITNGN